MRRIAIINQKGGVGKTTTTANLGAALAQAGQRVLLIDLDPQGHLSLHFGFEVSPEKASVYDVLTASAPVAEAVVKLRENISIVPADIDLAGVEAELVSVMGREVLLREAIDGYGADVDVLLIDCPPSLGVLTINALVASEEVLIPLQAHFFGLQGLSKLLETVELVRQRINPSLRVLGVVLCMHDSATRLACEVSDDIRRFFAAGRGTDVPWKDARLFTTTIRRNIKLAESSSFGETIFDYAPTSNGAADYAALAAELFGDLAPPPPQQTQGEDLAKPVSVAQTPFRSTAGKVTADAARGQARRSASQKPGGTRVPRDANGRFVKAGSAADAPPATGGAAKETVPASISPCQTVDAPSGGGITSGSGAEAESGSGRFGQPSVTAPSGA